MLFAPTFLALLALLAPDPTPAGDGHPGPSGPRMAQAVRPPPPAPVRAPVAAPPAPAAAAPVPGRVTPAPPPGAPPAGRHPTTPAPPSGAAPRPPGHYYGPGYYPYYPYYVSPWAYSAYLDAPWWWGWGWGYGYYPVYPEPPAPPGEAPPVNRINAELAFTGGPTEQRSFSDPTVRTGPGTSAGFSLRVESRHLGIHAGYDGFFTGGYVDFGSATALDYFTAHATWSFVSGQSGRLRLEGGVSVLAWPTVPPFAAATAVGPEAGLSGEVSLLGPLGIQGYARVTPWPRQVTDFYAAAALRFGPMAFTGGWRDLRADGGDTEPSLRFAGPQFGLALLF